MEKDPSLNEHQDTYEDILLSWTSSIEVTFAVCSQVMKAAPSVFTV